MKPFAFCDRLLAVAAALLLLCGGAAAADFYTVLTVTVTNQVNGIATNGTDTLTVIGDTRRATNNIASSPSTLWLGTNAQLRAATNLYNHLALYPFGSAGTRLSLQWLNTNQFRLIGQNNQVVAGSAGGVWGTVVSTNYPVTNRVTMFSPATAASPTTQTNFGNAIADYLNVGQTFLNQTAAALSNFLSLNQPQTAANKTLQTSSLVGGSIVGVTNLTGSNIIGSNVVLLTFVLYGGSISNLTALEGIVSRLVGGYYTNGIFDRGIFTNSVFHGSNYFGGAAISLVGLGVDNFVSLTSTSTVAAFGPLQGFYRSDGPADAVDANDVLGNIAFLGYGTTSYTAGARIRAYAEETFTDTSGASSLRFETTPSGANLTVVRMRVESDGTVRIFGTNTVNQLIATNLTALAGSLSNLVFNVLTGSNLVVQDFHSTGSNRFDLAISRTVTNNTTLANGVNLVDPGFKSYVKVSGPTAAYSIDKITRGYNGREIEFQKNDSYTLTIADESGSGGGTDADRVRTGTGGNVTITNNPGSFFIRYDSDISRWVLKWRTN